MLASAAALSRFPGAVQAGKHLPGDERSKGVQPTATVKDFAAAVDWILQKVGTSAD